MAFRKRVQELSEGGRWDRLRRGRQHAEAGLRARKPVRRLAGLAEDHPYERRGAVEPPSYRP